MKSIDQRAGKAYLDALTCVEYRVPPMGSQRAPAYLLSLALRYGLIGAATTHHLLLSAVDEQEDQEIMHLAHGWGELVEEHVRQFLRHKLPFVSDPSVPGIVGQLAYQPTAVELRMFRFGSPLSHTLSAAASQFAEDYRRVIVSGCPLLKRSKIRREFYTLSDKSVGFALNFFDRRQSELEELPEIALLGE